MTLTLTQFDSYLVSGGQPALCIHVPSFIRIGPRNSDKQTFDLLPNDLDLDKTNNRETFVDKMPHLTLLHYRSGGITLSVSASYYGKIVLHYRLGNGITLSGVSLHYWLSLLS